MPNNVRWNTLDPKPIQWKSLDSLLLVVVDFWGTHCPQCHLLYPSGDRLAEVFAGAVRVGAS